MKIRLASIVASTILLASIVASAQTDAINFNTTYQTIRGFGTSTAWQPVLNSTQANNLFGVGAGQVGLTILRSRIDPSSTTGGSNWQTELKMPNRRSPSIRRSSFLRRPGPRPRHGRAMAASTTVR